jgi:DNA-directed RNA polymerase specialized sigma24 family protein
MIAKRNVGGGFPDTRQSAIRALKSDDGLVRARAYETVLSCYWKPIYKYIRLKWSESRENAEDLTQAFLATAYEKRYFVRYYKQQARFQSFLRTCVDRFVANDRKYAQRLKRAGDASAVPLDFDLAEEELRRSRGADQLSMEDFFEREWIRSLLALTVESLREECLARGRETHYALFARYDLADDEAGGPPTYQQLAAEFNLSSMTVTNYLAAIRRDFRRLLLDHLRELTATDEEYRRTARRVLGIEVG